MNRLRPVSTQLLKTEFPRQMNKRAFLLAAFIVFSTVPCFVRGADSSCPIDIVNGDSKSIRVDVEVADNDIERARGLMYRKNVPAGRGMLFVFGREQYLNFWMKNTYVPLSIAYIGKEGVIQEIYDMKPLDTSVTYPSRYPARYALEVSKGWFRANRITPGCKVILHGCIGK